MRSALGIRRIKNAQVSQVMRATEADIHLLRTRLNEWGVPHFRSYPLLLRALTHPSISNWAERVLDLPKRSLGPNTLELLGDRVVGTCVAYRLQQLQKDGRLNLRWQPGGPSALVKSLVGNRGMSQVAARIGLDELMRWEKARPPSAFRHRLDAHGVDQTTGLASNVEINGLAAAYEAVAAAVYLDGGFHSAEKFVHSTLLQNPQEVQAANADVRDYEEILSQELAELLGASVSFVTSRHRAGRSAALAVKSFERVQCEILDLEAVEVQNAAHKLYYAAVALRPMSEVDNDIREEDLLSAGTHFSVESARIAALMRSIQVLRGALPACSKRGWEATVPKRLRMREIIFGADAPQLNARFDKGGDRWWLEGDYCHSAQLLNRAGVVEMGNLGELDVGDVQERLRSMRERVEGGVGVGSAQTSSTGRYQEFQLTRGRQGDGGMPWRSRSEEGGDVISEDAVAKCLAVGGEIELRSSLWQVYGGLKGEIRSAEEVCSAVRGRLEAAGRCGAEERSLQVKGYHAIGHNAMRLWSVQRSMRDAQQERSEVIGASEGRGWVGAGVEEEMIGKRGLAEVRDLRVKRAFVGLGICVEQIGVQTAMAWLSGAERRLKGERSQSRGRADGTGGG